MTNTKRILQRNLTNPPQSNAMNTFSFRLTYALAIRNISQAELATACGLAPSNISQYLNKNAIPRIDKITKIAKKLNVSELWLIGDGVVTDIDRSQGLDVLAPDERNLVLIYRRADREGKDFLLNTAKIYEIMKKDK
jgi:transcriptional regulator with XRE-family HTH domain